MINEDKVIISFDRKKRILKIHNSYLIADSRIMNLKLQSHVELVDIRKSKKSCINKWIAHNRLYNLGLKIEQSFLRNYINLDKLDMFMDKVKDTILTRNESLFKRVCYWILSR